MKKLIFLTLLLSVALLFVSCQGDIDTKTEATANNEETSIETTETIQMSEETSSVESTSNSEEASSVESTSNAEETSSVEDISNTEETTLTHETKNDEPYEIKVDDYTLIKNENGCYLTFDDISKYQSNSIGNSALADVKFSSMKDFKETVVNGLLSDSDKQIIAGFPKYGEHIQTCDFNDLYEPIVPKKCNMNNIYWMGEIYTFDISLGNDAFGSITYLTKEYYDIFFEHYENFFNSDLITVTSVEEKNGVITTNYDTATSVLKNVRYTLSVGNKIVIVEKEYCIDSDYNYIFGYTDDIPYAITLYCVEGNTYYRVSLNELEQDPTDEWLLEFGLKPYIENDHEVM